MPALERSLGTSTGFQVTGFGHGCVVTLEPDRQGGVRMKRRKCLSTVAGSTIFERIEGKNGKFRHVSSLLCSGLFPLAPSPNRVSEPCRLANRPQVTGRPEGLPHGPPIKALPCCGHKKTAQWRCPPCVSGRQTRVAEFAATWKR